MKLSIVIPVFNEKNTFEEIIRRVRAVSLPGWEKEIIVADDASNDGTEHLLGKLSRELNFIFIRHAKNSGKGAAVKTALEQITGDFVLVQDADLEYDPQDYPKLINALDEKTQVVYGSRNINPARKGYAHYVLGAKFLTFLMNFLFDANLTDTYTCYKLLPSSLARSLSIISSGFELEAEITAKILKRGISIKEIPIKYYPRKFMEGKKIRFLDGLIGLWTIIRCKLFG